MDFQKGLIKSLILSFLLSSCSTTTPQPTIDVGAIYTSAVSTAFTNASHTKTANYAIDTKTVSAHYAIGTQTASAHYIETIMAIPTQTQAPTPNATQTLQAQMFIIHPDGFYLINVDIAPGVWRSDGVADNCYWAITDKTGNILNNHFGMSGGTAYVPATAFQVQFENCGDWTFLSP